MMVSLTKTLEIKYEKILQQIRHSVYVCNLNNKTITIKYEKSTESTYGMIVFKFCSKMLWRVRYLAM